MQKLKALLFADQRSFRNTELIDLITRSGFDVDLVTSCRFDYVYKNINKLIFVGNEADIPSIAVSLADHYALKVILGDKMLKLIKSSNLTEAQKLLLLPVNNLSSIKHICSKIELSKIFQQAKVNTPAYSVLDESPSMIDSLNIVGYPALIKIDYSGGGEGVFKLNSAHDLKNIPSHFATHPLLIQQFIKGKLLDLSAFFQNGNLIQFSCSESLKTTKGPFGPSKVRVYHDIKQLDPLIIDELSRIGMAIRAHGFCNISCIESRKDYQRYYFEADMRPNDWANYTCHLEDDPALRLHDYFYHQKTFDNLLIQTTNNKVRNLFVNPSRLNAFEIITNKYNWIREAKIYSLLIYWLSLLYNNPYECCKIFTVKHLKPRVSKRVWDILKSIGKTTKD